MWQLPRSELAHYQTFARYLKAYDLSAPCAWSTAFPVTRALAKGYNGPGYAKHDYHSKIAAAWRARR